MSRTHPDPQGPSPSAPEAADAAPPSPLSVESLLLGNLDEAQFTAVSEAWIARFDPHDLDLRVLAEMVVLSASRLRKANLLEPADAIPDLAWCRFQALAERNFRNACRDLRRLLESRAARPPASGPDAPPSQPSPDVAEAPPPPPESTAEEIIEAYTHWRRHIALVKSVSDEWPILLRLRREVEDVAAWLADGKTEEELMRWYPGLTRADIAACRACDAEGLCGPFDTADGPYPEGLPVLDHLPETDSGP